MGKGFDFICPSCLMANRYSNELNSISDIAYSMPDSLFEKLRSALEKEHADLAKEMNAKPDLICCITWGDIEECLITPMPEGSVLWGTYTLTSDWLKRNGQRFGLTKEALDALPDGSILLEEGLGFFHTIVDGCKFPTIIRDMDQHLLSDERRCAKCGQLLSPDTGKAEELRILLQGSSRAGKTSCMIAVFDKLLENNYLVETGFRSELSEGSGPNATDLKRYHNWIRQELEYYRKGIKVEKTHTAVEKPIAYSLLVKIDDREFVLTFVDMPGEYFDKADEQQQKEENLLKLYLPIYDKCHVVWTCLRYETVVSRELTEEQWDKLAHNTGLPRSHAAATDYQKYYSGFSKLIREFESRGRKRPAHAVILTVTDGIVSVYDPDENDLNQMRNHHIIPGLPEMEPQLIQFKTDTEEMVFRERECYNLCRRVSSYIQGKNQNIYALFQKFSSQTKYFALAAYGRPALDRPSGTAASVDVGQGMPPAPFHVEMPLFWSMAIGGFLPIEYKVHYERELGLAMSLWKGKSGREKIGDQWKICRSFHKADAATSENLLEDKERYKEHYTILKKGETI